MSDEKNKWLCEYEAFLKSDSTHVPQTLSKKTLDQISNLLRPSAWLVFSKVFGIHLVVGLLSLSICHQFGMNPFGTEMSLDRWFMTMWGHGTCMFACGAFFTSLSFLGAGIFLSKEELYALRRTELLQTLALGALSLALFALVGTELAFTFAALWLIGAWAGGILATEALWGVSRVKAIV